MKTKLDKIGQNSTVNQRVMLSKGSIIAEEMEGKKQLKFKPYEESESFLFAGFFYQQNKSKIKRRCSGLFED